MDSNKRGGNGDKGEGKEAAEKPKRQSAYRIQEETVKEDQEEPKPETPEAPAVEPDKAAEEAQQEAPFLSTGIVDGIRDTFRRYVVEHVVPPEKQEGPINVNVDLNFLKEHGVPLISTLVQNLAKAIVPPKIELPLTKAQPADRPQATEEVPGAPDEQAADQPAGEPGQEAAQDVEVSVNFDLANFLKSLMQPKPVPPKDSDE